MGTIMPMHRGQLVTIIAIEAARTFVWPSRPGSSIAQGRALRDPGKGQPGTAVSGPFSLGTGKRLAYSRYIADT